MPIKAEDGKVLGTFGTYFTEKREPLPEEIAAIDSLASVAASVLQRETD
jgi:hypothetical protein